MSQIVHVANTNVEFELASSFSQPLEKSWARHPLCLQLQFLPLLYASPEDLVAVTAMPSLDYLNALQEIGWWAEGFPQLVLLKEVTPFKGKVCLSWGPSLQVQEWAMARQMNYSVPKWSVAQSVNSKAFSFRYTCLAQAALLHCENELEKWLQQTEGRKVFKTCFGLSGKGNWLFEGRVSTPELLNFCRNEWQHQRPMIAEPWLDRVHDFSTQWLIHSDQQIEYLGATRFATNEQGVYQGTFAGPENILFDSIASFLDDHRKYVFPVLQEIATLGFFGYVGIDALIYREERNSDLSLYPLVEINGRQTMSLVALRLQQKICPEQIFRLALEPKGALGASLLPNQLPLPNGKTVQFHRKLTGTIIE